MSAASERRDAGLRRSTILRIQMAQGPPTPPPTSTTEFQDQVRDSVTGGTGTSSGTPEENTSMTRANPVVDSYQQAFPQICGFALRGDFPTLVQRAELSDLKVACTFNAFLLRSV